MGSVGVDGHEVFEDRRHARVFAAESLFGGEEGLFRIGLGLGPAARSPARPQAAAARWRAITGESFGCGSWPICIARSTACWASLCRRSTRRSMATLSQTATRCGSRGPAGDHWSRASSKSPSAPRVSPRSRRGQPRLFMAAARRADGRRRAFFQIRGFRGRRPPPCRTRRRGSADQGLEMQARRRARPRRPAALPGTAGHIVGLPPGLVKLAGLHQADRHWQRSSGSSGLCSSSLA